MSTNPPIPLPYTSKNKLRVVTAAALFDGHDAAINIMRRIIQSSGAEVIHLGHNRSVEEIVNCAIQEDAQAIAITSYQGGHVEYFKYMHDLLKERGAGHIKLFGGGGGVILPSEIEELHNYGITKIYHPDDGRSMGLQGMINNLLEQTDFPTGHDVEISEVETIKERNSKTIGRIISAVENYPEKNKEIIKKIKTLIPEEVAPVLGITGTGGAGKSSLVDELVRRYLMDFEDKTIAIVSVDPSRRRTGGALLGDRIRMNSITNDRVYMRSLATRQSNLALSKYVQDAIDILRAAEFDLIIVETSGIGQSDTAITDHSDASLYVMTPEYGAASQLEKIDMIDFADVIALNKFDKRGALDALRDVKKQYKRNRNLWDTPDSEIPVYGTIASQFNDVGMNTLYRALIDQINKVSENSPTKLFDSTFKISASTSEKQYIIPPSRVRYLSEISESNRRYDKNVEDQAEIAQKLYGLELSIHSISENEELEKELKDSIINGLKDTFEQIKLTLEGTNWKIIEDWQAKVATYTADDFVYKVRNKEFSLKTYTVSLSQSKIPKISLPKYKAWGDVLKWNLQENVPGEFPFTAGVFPFKRTGEDPTRMFAGEGGPERTNRRFHYLSKGMPAARLSTAFDSVTLYGEDPDYRPDIYGKVGNSGVNVCCLDDAKKLYSGFNLADPTTSVSMTINWTCCYGVCLFYECSR